MIEAAARADQLLAEGDMAGAEQLQAQKPAAALASPARPIVAGFSFT